jgi:hypothetical protein
MPSKKQDQVQQGEPSPHVPQPERKSKQALLLELISSEGGASLEELTSATGWLPHTVRAAITGLRKRGHGVQCQRCDGASRYTVGSGGR